MKAISKRQDAEHDRLVYLAWTTAALSRSKKLPDLKKLLKTGKVDPRLRKHKSWQAQLAGWESFAGPKRKKKG
jgi:hypothetical protein